GVVAWLNQDRLLEQLHWRFVMGPSLLTVEQEREKAATSGSDFQECARGCPRMVVVPAGSFLMGAPTTDGDKRDHELRQHPVVIAKPFAVGRTEVTFDEWDACVNASACPRVNENWGRGNLPVINISWDHAKQYVAWLARVTGRKYRLLSEAEW